MNTLNLIQCNVHESNMIENIYTVALWIAFKQFKLNAILSSLICFEFVCVLRVWIRNSPRLVLQKFTLHCFNLKLLNYALISFKIVYNYSILVIDWTITPLYLEVFEYIELCMFKVTQHLKYMIGLLYLFVDCKS